MQRRGRLGFIILVFAAIAISGSCDPVNLQRLSAPDQASMLLGCAGGGEYCRELTGAEENRVESAINRITNMADTCQDAQSNLGSTDITAYDEDDGYEAWGSIGSAEISINANMIDGSVGAYDLALMLVHEWRHNEGDTHSDPGTFSDGDALSYTCCSLSFAMSSWTSTGAVMRRDLDVVAFESEVRSRKFPVGSFKPSRYKLHTHSSLDQIN
jgi:hypothetical protein